MPYCGPVLLPFESDRERQQEDEKNPYGLGRQPRIKVHESSVSL